MIQTEGERVGLIIHTPDQLGQTGLFVNVRCGVA